MNDIYPAQEMAPGEFSPRSNGTPHPSREHLEQIALWNAQKLREVQSGINEANEGGGQPSRYYNH